MPAVCKVSDWTEWSECPKQTCPVKDELAPPAVSFEFGISSDADDAGHARMNLIKQVKTLVYIYMYYFQWF